MPHAVYHNPQPESPPVKLSVAKSGQGMWPPNRPASKALVQGVFNWWNARGWAAGPLQFWLLGEHFHFAKGTSEGFRDLDFRQPLSVWGDDESFLPWQEVHQAPRRAGLTRQSKGFDEPPPQVVVCSKGPGGRPQDVISCWGRHLTSRYWRIPWTCVAAGMKPPCQGWRCSCRALNFWHRGFYAHSKIPSCVPRDFARLWSFPDGRSNVPTAESSKQAEFVLPDRRAVAAALQRAEARSARSATGQIWSAFW